MEALEARLAALEKSVRWWRYATVGLVLALAGGATVAAALQPKIPEVIKAKKFEVVNEDGKALVVLYCNNAGHPRDEGGCAWIRGTEDSGSAMIYVQPEYAAVQLQGPPSSINDEGKGATMVTLQAGNHPSIRLSKGRMCSIDIDAMPSRPSVSVTSDRDHGGFFTRFGTEILTNGVNVIR